MLKSMAIIRGETDKIELSLNKYTAAGERAKPVNLSAVGGAAVAGGCVY